MKTYHITLTSWALWIPTLILPPLLGSLFLLKFSPNNVGINIVIFILLFAVAFYLQQFTSKAKIVVFITENTMAIKWKSQFLFHKEKDKEIRMTDIMSYKYQEDTNFDLFKLTMKNGEEVNLWHSTLTNADDFKRLVADFSQLVIQIEKRHNITDKIYTPAKNEVNISKEKTIYESPAAPFLAGFAIIAIIALAYYGFVNPSKKDSASLAMLVPISGALFFVFKFFDYRKRNKKG